MPEALPAPETVTTGAGDSATAPGIPDASTAAPNAAGAHHEPYAFEHHYNAHVKAYPAIQWLHDQPILVLNAAKYAQLHYDHLSGLAQFTDATPDAEYKIWASEITHEKLYQGPPAAQLAKAMWVAREEAVCGALPRELSFLNQQTFWSTIALVLTALVLLVFARRKPDQIKPANRLQHVIEAVVLFIRDDVVRPNISHHSDAWTPFFASMFIALLACNLFGLVPIFATATGNFAVNAAFALFIFILMIFMGIKHNGPLRFWVRVIPMPWSWQPFNIIIYLLLAVLEWLTLFTRPASLALRLFANMMAGHMVLMVFGSLAFIIVEAQHDRIALGMTMGLFGGALTLCFYFLELLVAFIQAYVFTLLAAVFIGACAYPEH